jgi:hypothetical protein
MFTKEDILRITSKIKNIELKKSKINQEKIAASARLYEYELNGLIFYIDEKITSGVRVSSGKAKYTNNFYTVSGELSKVLNEPSFNNRNQEKMAATARLYQYELNGFIFYIDEKITSGVRVSSGKAKYTSNFYTVSGELSKVLDS